MTDHKDPTTTRELAYQSYINEETPNGNSRMDNIVLCAGPSQATQRHIATQVDLAFQAGWGAALSEALARAEKAETMAAKLAEALRGAFDSLKFSSIELEAQASIPREDTEMLDRRIKIARETLAEYEAEATELKAVSGVSILGTHDGVLPDDIFDILQQDDAAKRAKIGTLEKHLKEAIARAEKAEAALGALKGGE